LPKNNLPFWRPTQPCLWAGPVRAEVHYVDVNGANATPPYTNWVTAATNIQNALDAAVQAMRLW